MSPTVDSARAEQMRKMQTDAERLAGVIDDLFPFDANGIGLPLPAGIRVFDEVTCNQIFVRSEQMHSGANYGGNIESTPALPDARFGKIIIGNSEDGGFFDPDLKRVLSKQRKQPIVELLTDWLTVGHVDEVMCIVPSASTDAQRFAVLHAGPQVALDLLAAAHRRYRSGLPPNHPERLGNIPPVISRREMIAGSRPVTRLMRGKAWFHRHTRPPAGELPLVLEPPRTYLELCSLFEGSPQRFDQTIGHVDGAGPDRFYHADISVRELLWAELDARGASTNKAIEDNLIAPMLKTLAEALPGVRQLPLPVVFDQVSSIKALLERGQQTIAFTVDLVNLQVLGRDLLIPRPYGPRMNNEDAIFVVQEVMRDHELPASLIDRVNPALIRKHDMNTANYWVEPSERAILEGRTIILESYGGIRDTRDIIGLFNDSFPNASPAELRRQIIDANAGNFDGNQLKAGWNRFVIRDGMVDLFELFSFAVVEELGLTPHLVDSWFYHINSGGIHCGTNVLQVPPTSGGGIPNVKDVPDVQDAEAAE